MTETILSGLKGRLAAKKKEGKDRHLHQVEIFVQWIPGSRRPRTFRGKHGGRGLQIEASSAAAQSGEENNGGYLDDPDFRAYSRKADAAGEKV